MEKWNNANLEAFSGWPDNRIKGMEARHEPAVKMFSRYMLREIESFYKEKNKDENFKILDIGCGSGYLFLKLLESHPGLIEKTSFIGIDSSKSMIERALQNKEIFIKTRIKEPELQELFKERLQFKTLDFLKSGFNKREFSVVTSLESIYYIFDLELAIKKVHEILDGKGSFLLMIEDDMFKTGDKFQDDERLRTLTREINVNTFHFLTVNDYLNILNKSGFFKISCMKNDGFIFIEGLK
ncbi:MAG: class I SAM-dependent methyltransferase [Promethearchaeota archaeon]